MASTQETSTGIIKSDGIGRIRYSIAARGWHTYDTSTREVLLGVYGPVTPAHLVTHVRVRVNEAFLLDRLGPRLANRSCDGLASVTLDNKSSVTISASHWLARGYICNMSCQKYASSAAWDSLICDHCAP